MIKPIDFIKTPEFKEHLEFLADQRDIVDQHFQTDNIIRYVPQYHVQLSVGFLNMEDKDAKNKPIYLGNQGLKDRYIWRSSDRGFFELGRNLMTHNKTSKQFKDNLFKMVDDYIFIGAEKILLSVREPDLLKVIQHKFFADPLNNDPDYRDSAIYGTTCYNEELSVRLDHIWGEGERKIETGVETVKAFKKQIVSKILPVYNLAKAYSEGLEPVCREVDEARSKLRNQKMAYGNQ